MSVIDTQRQKPAEVPAKLLASALPCRCPREPLACLRLVAGKHCSGGAHYLVVAGRKSPAPGKQVINGRDSRRRAKRSLDRYGKRLLRILTYGPSPHTRHQ